MFRRASKIFANVFFLLFFRCVIIIIICIISTIRIYYLKVDWPVVK